MKNALPLLALGVALVFFQAAPLKVFATSGACSGHGGVNCAAGQDSDGSVICYDGWRNSSVQYSAMVMCSGYTTPTLVPEPTPAPVYEPTPEPVVVVETEPVVTTPVVTSNSRVETAPVVVQETEFTVEDDETFSDVVAQEEEVTAVEEVQAETTPGEDAAAAVVGLGTLGAIGYGLYRGAKFLKGVLLK